MIPGFLQIVVSGWLRAGGAMAVFVIVYFYTPASLVVPEASKVAGPPYRIYLGSYYDKENNRSYPDCRLTREMQQLIDKNIEWLASLNPPVQRLLIKAAIDKSGSQDYNRRLSERCAYLVANAYISRGFISPSAISLKGVGEEMASPLFDYQNKDAQKNFNTYIDIEVEQMSSGTNPHVSIKNKM